MSRALILGCGPVALVVGRLLEGAGYDVTLLARSGSERAQRLVGLERRIVAEPSKPSLARLAGKVAARLVFATEDLEHSYQLVLVAVPLTAARSTLADVLVTDKVAKGAVVVVVSGGLGLSSELSALSEESGGPEFSVVTFSHFFAAAKWSGNAVVLRALKKQVRTGGAEAARRALEPFLSALRGYGVAVEEGESRLWAESRNLNLYVHSALGLTEYALEATFSRSPCPRYLYKLYPEGPVSPVAIRGYARLLRDLQALFGDLGLPAWNFLSFLQEEGYPVPDVYLRASDVDRFPEYSMGRQAELLYARYTGLLVDPYSRPDEEGRYFDFSAVAIAAMGDSGVPRVPGEELFNLWVARGAADCLKRRTPMIAQLLGNFLRAASIAPDGTRETAGQAWRLAKKRGLCLGARMVERTVVGEVL